MLERIIKIESENSNKMEMKKWIVKLKCEQIQQILKIKSDNQKLYKNLTIFPLLKSSVRISSLVELICNLIQHIQAVGTRSSYTCVLYVMLDCVAKYSLSLWCLCHKIHITISKQGSNMPVKKIIVEIQHNALSSCI